jgi:hypothetical protein
LAELQKDPITRGDFLGFGLLGAISGAILTIPPVAFLLSPVIKTNVLGQTDIDQGWQRVASIDDLKKLKPGTPDVFEVEFPIEQVYSEQEIQDKFPDSQKSEAEFTIRHAVWISWRARSRSRAPRARVATYSARRRSRPSSTRRARGSRPPSGTRSWAS